MRQFGEGKGERGGDGSDEEENGNLVPICCGYVSGEREVAWL
jgi:hypothetical protein